MGSRTASLRASLAPSRPATSSHLTLGRSCKMAPARALRSFLESSSMPSSSLPLPAPPVELPLAPTMPGFLRLASADSRCFLSDSARSMYSVVLERIISLDLAFFSHLRASMNSSSAW